MKAIVQQKYGGPEVLELKEIQKPIPNKDELLIKVHAATVNRTDCANLRAKPVIMRLVTGLTKPKKQTPGTDFAGVVESVGENVAEFKVGDRVFGFDDTVLQSHAEYLIISEKNAIAKIPNFTSYNEATASIEGAHYAINFINKVSLKKGDKVLVNGATGAIGSAMVQLVKYYGAEVTAVCGTESIELVKGIGADKVVDYKKEDFTKLAEQFDYVFDAVGKNEFRKCKSILKLNGIYISSELGKNAQNLFLSMYTPIFDKKKVKFPFPVDRKGSAEFVSKLLEEGKFKPIIDRVYPLEETANAFTYVETGKKIGNVVIEIS